MLSNRKGLRTAIVCAVLIVAYAAASLSAILTKSPTIDEPGHAMAGWLDTHLGDFRFEAVNPSLWKMWAAIGNLNSHPPMVFDGPVWQNLTMNPDAEVKWATRVLFETPGTDGAAFVNRSRAMMMLLGVATAGLLAGFAYRLAGPVAAITATFLWCTDPTVLAHSAVVKSDVAFALVLLGIVWATWSLGRSASWPKAALVGILCGVECNMKMSGVIVGPLLAATLFARVCLPGKWFGRPTFAGKFVRAAAVGSLAIFLCAGVTWACYGFRYRPAPSPDVHMDLQHVIDLGVDKEAAVRLSRKPTPAELSAQKPGLTEQAITFAAAHRLLPEAYLAGLQYQHVCTLWWVGYLDGDVYFTGRWSYFPKAIIYKTPLPSLAVGAVAGVVLLACFRKLIRKDAWTVVAVAVPVVVFGAAAFSTHLNIGLRNILALYPLAFLAVGVAAAITWRRRPRLTVFVGAVAAVGLVTSDVVAWPNYINYFNAPSDDNGGSDHLIDSNLDWGQDVNQLARWQQQNPDRPVYAILFTTVPPEYYGFRQSTLIAGKHNPPGVVAVSVTTLKHVYSIDEKERKLLQQMTASPDNLITILPGGTIYLFKYDGFVVPDR